MVMMTLKLVEIDSYLSCSELLSLASRATGWSLRAGLWNDDLLPRKHLVAKSSKETAILHLRNPMQGLAIGLCPLLC